jgi:glycosyltransferase involved in cell wall biosynthesis
VQRLNNDGRPVVSVIVACFNKEAVIGHTHERLSCVLKETGPDHEIIYVDDGSADRTATALRDLHLASPHVRVIRLSRNCGHQIAVTAGLKAEARQRIAAISQKDASARRQNYAIACARDTSDNGRTRMLRARSKWLRPQKRTPIFHWSWTSIEQ